MRVVFPCNGVIVLTKEDMQKLEDFYQAKLTNSKLYDYYQNSNSSIQIGYFSYFPKKSSFLLKDANLLSIKQLRDILSLNTAQDNTVEQDEDEQITDSSILSNPFFKTLKPLD